MKLKELRLSRNLTQEQFAKKFDLSQATYSNYEKENGTEPNIDTLKRFADYFNVSLDYLVGRSWNNQVGYIPDDKKELISLILSLDKDETKEVSAYINGYVTGRSKEKNQTFKVFDD